ncbi:efflux RND transporter periplasmic adaptor subunit [Dehalobacter sp. DCM]|uniref:HlyD family secretion protein n=1 Tax=Dehalobacter sp. DCM TaxID=2907827 RepID=UPI0030818029|nr:efflux RND transporter periplasmic adaptor subunit [Dehalobacter sp. DCM]
MTKKKKILAVVIVLVVLVAGYFGWEHYASADDHMLNASGTIEATTVNLSVKIPGTIGIFEAEPGDEVKPNDLVAEILRNDLIAQLERDRLNVAIAQNNLDELQSGARSQQIKQSQANVNIKQVAYNKAQDDLKRAEELFQEGNLSQVELEGIQNSQKIAFHQLDAAKAELSLLVEGSSNNKIKAAQNQVKLMEAVVKATEAQLADLQIKSPIDGIIQTKNYETGEYVTAGAVLATVVNLNKVWINVFIPTDDLPFVRLGKEVDFTISGLDTVFKGIITEIASQGEFTPKTIQTKRERANIVFKVKITVDNSQGILKPGMPADVVIKADDLK